MFVIYEAELGNSSPCVLFKKCMSGNEEREEASIDAQHGRLESNGRLTRQEDPCATNNDVSTQEQFDTTKEGKNRCLCYERLPFFHALAVGPIGRQPYLANVKNAYAQCSRPTTLGYPSHIPNFPPRHADN